MGLRPGGGRRGPGGPPPPPPGAGAPGINYNPDHGLGMLAIGALYWFEEGYEPYRDSLAFRVFVSTRLVNAHELRWDSQGLAGLPLRLWAVAGLWTTPARVYCGVGNRVACDPAEARAQADARGLAAGSAERAEFERHYYQLRHISPYGQVSVRWRPSGARDGVELLAGWRGAYTQPGDWGDYTPYPGSLYATHFPGGERGMASVLQAGVVIDTRDLEPAPSRGVWAEATLRGAAPAWGSDWSYLGGNATVRGYLPLDPGGSLVLASRLVVDLVAGDLPITELDRVGGSVDYGAFGGHRMGRGILEYRFLGRIKVLDQTALRWRFWRANLLAQRLSFGLATYAEAGWIGFDWDDWGGDPASVIVSFGGGPRLVWNELFVVRFDLATSPVEHWEPFFYAQLGNVF